VYVVDLHTHTRFFHGFRSRPTPFDPVGARLLDGFARRRGIDGLALTNHDYSYRPSSSRTVTVPGIEITTTQGHLLVVGPDPPQATVGEQLTPPEAVQLAHQDDCAAIMAHPFRNSMLPDSSAEFDAVEVNGKHTGDVERVETLADQRDLPLVGGSDAHYPVEVGRAVTLVDAERLTPRSVVAAIRDDRVEPAVRDHPADRVLRRLYRKVHRFKGHVEEEAPATAPGAAPPPETD
jgi:predicted metal-dependent phosphoesterase TrpH